MLTLVNDNPPVWSGGLVADGTYWCTSEQLFTGLDGGSGVFVDDAGYGRGASRVFVFANGQLEGYDFTVAGPSSSSASFCGPQLFVASTCPTPTSAAAYPYSVLDPRHVLLYAGADGLALTLELQGDAGSPDPGSSSPGCAASCNLLVNDGGWIHVSAASGALPTGNGGTVAAGTYDLQSDVVYNAPADAGAPLRRTKLVLSPGSAISGSFASVDSVFYPGSFFGSEVHIAGSYAAVGGTLAVTLTCPSWPILAGSYDFTSTGGASILTIYADSNAAGEPEVMTFALVGP